MEKAIFKVIIEGLGVVYLHNVCCSPEYIGNNLNKIRFYNLRSLPTPLIGSKTISDARKW